MHRWYPHDRDEALDEVYGDVDAPGGSGSTWSPAWTVG